jgi:glycosyltransferase involved in cell wall biosynthesis
MVRLCVSALAWTLTEMRILHIISSVNPLGGGPIEGILQLAAADNRLRQDVEVLSLDDPSDSFVKDFPLDVHAVGRGHLSYHYNPQFVPWLRANLQRFDVAIVNGLWQYHSFGAWRALHGSPLPYVVYTHGMLDPWFKKTYPLKHLKKSLYWPWAEYRVLRDAGAVLFTCEQERLLARQSFPHYRANEVVVGLGISAPDVKAESVREEFFAQYPHLRGKRIALFLSRIHEKKGCDLLIKAFARELAFDPDWHLLLCGPDQMGLQASLQKLAEELGIGDRLTWAGMIRGNMKWGAIHASEVFVLPSHQENFGIVVAEALACGVPTLISNKVNIWQEVERGGAGLVANDDLEGTCHLLRQWQQIPPEAHAAMRANTTPCFQQNFEAHHAAANLLGALHKVVQRANGTTQEVSP